MDESQSQQQQAITHSHQTLCDSCDSDVSVARAWESRTKSMVSMFAAATVCTTPLMLLFLSYLDATHRAAAWVPDDRILLASIASSAALVAYCFKGALKND